ncbi:unnamed protein product [Mytilus coruscus]|uniref:Uncharacterized protein n=1 Tax=Mytilus coruscus TaxID=42192 RepID=A0A6J8EFB7_MYTCO|nr:unnamed protein product [Mytilus coruscus]
MKLDIPVRRISGGRRILRSDLYCWSFTKRKTRSDALSEDVKRQVYEYWKKSGISRPTGNKSDVKRGRLGPNINASHMIQILEKTQTEVYTNFTIENPETKYHKDPLKNCKTSSIIKIMQYLDLNDFILILGPQDAAGRILKRQADLAVSRGQCRNQTAKDLYNFGIKFLTATKSETCRRRIYRYLETIQYNAPLYFKPVNKMRSVHSVRVNIQKVTYR